jgi:hypothetical protein
VEERVGAVCRFVVGLAYMYHAARSLYALGLIGFKHSFSVPPRSSK